MTDQSNIRYGFDACFARCLFSVTAFLAGLLVVMEETDVAKGAR